MGDMIRFPEDRTREPEALLESRAGSLILDAAEVLPGGLTSVLALLTSLLVTELGAPRAADALALAGHAALNWPTTPRPAA